jgi:hypothetical protein
LAAIAFVTEQKHRRDAAAGTGPALSATGKRLPSHTACAIVVAISFTFCNLGEVYG